MDTIAMVEGQVRAGQRLLDRLAAAGVPVLAAGWVKPVDEDRWSLLIATPLVDERGPAGAYREVYAVHRSLEAELLKPHEIKLVGKNSAIAKDLETAQANGGAPWSLRDPPTSLGGMKIETIYVYPPPGPKAAGSRQSIMKFALTTDENPMAVMDRFRPGDRLVLNRTEWRGKEPRSCAVTPIKGRPRPAAGPGPTVFDIEVTYRPRGCITYTGGTRYDGWTAVVLDRGRDGTLLDGNGGPLPPDRPPVYRSIEVYEDMEFADIDFGDFIGEREAPGIEHVPYERVMSIIGNSRKASVSANASFVAPRRSRPMFKITISNRESGTAVDGFGTYVANIQSTTPHLRQVVVDRVTEAVTGYVEGRYSIKSLSNGEMAFVDLSDLVVDCTANARGDESRFNCITEYLPPTFLDELAARLVATYDISASVVEDLGRRGEVIVGLVLKRDDRTRR